MEEVVIKGLKIAQDIIHDGELEALEAEKTLKDAADAITIDIKISEDVTIDDKTVPIVDKSKEEEEEKKVLTLKPDQILSRTRRRASALQAAISQALNAMELNSNVFNVLSKAQADTLRVYRVSFCQLCESFLPDNAELETHLRTAHGLVTLSPPHLLSAQTLPALNTFLTNYANELFPPSAFTKVRSRCIHDGRVLMY